MRILALETSTELGSCALWQDGNVIEHRCPPGRSHSETLLPPVKHMLAEAGLGITCLDAIAFGAGPGAFTGLRVACGIAQGLSLAADIPLVPVISLEAMAFDANGGQVLSLLDARMNEVYAATFERAGDELVLIGNIVVSPPEAVPLPQGSEWIACGNALAAYPVLLDRVRAVGVSTRPDILPLASAVAQLAAPRLERGETIDAAEAAPLYVRNKVAQTVAERLGAGGRA